MIAVTSATIRREQAAIRKWQGAVAEAVFPFESRWTLAALKRVDAGIYQRLVEQRSLFDCALVTGTAEEIEIHGAALCRGYAVAIQILERVAEPDDAYLLGQDMHTGFRVAIGQQKAAAQRVRELHGNAVIWITPDEVAAVIANVEAFKPIAAIKRLFPGAEMLDVHSGEPAKEDE
jgi:hypothetical protein